MYIPPTNWGREAQQTLYRSFGSASLETEELGISLPLGSKCLVRRGEPALQSRRTLSGVRSVMNRVQKGAAF